jgi:flagellar hook-basal body complex protein FliE
MTIQALNNLQSIRAKMSVDALRSEQSAGVGAAGGGQFAQHLEAAMNSTTSALQEADASSEALAAGDPNVGLHETMIAVEKADISFRAFTAVKNRAVEAYREVMRMQI